MLSMQAPAMCSLSIIKLGENSPADWSLINQKESVPGLSTAWTGEEYILGKRSGLKALE
jgi:hypothetical protein